jgi:hypothetical protein
VTAKVALRQVPGMGYGGFARGRIPAGAAVGEFTGRVLPRKAKRSDEEDQYHSGIIIGAFNGEYDGHPSAWIDYTTTGSVARFYNHSCEPNAAIYEFRCGMNHRIVVFESLRVIEEEEEITVDYGSKWFDSEDQRCLCGTATCKNPPKQEVKAATPTKGLTPTAPQKKVLDKKRKISVDSGSDDTASAVSEASSNTPTKGKIAPPPLPVAPRKKQPLSKKRKAAADDSSVDTTGAATQAPSESDKQNLPQKKKLRV